MIEILAMATVIALVTSGFIEVVKIATNLINDIYLQLQRQSELDSVQLLIFWSQNSD